MSATYEYHLSQVLAASNGALLTPLKIAAKILGLATQTLYNQIHKGTFPLSVVKLGKRCFVRTSDLASLVSGTSAQHQQIQVPPVVSIKPPPRPRGRPRKDAAATGSSCAQR